MAEITIPSAELFKHNLPDRGGDEAAGVKVIDDSITDHSRWSVRHEIIFTWKDGKTYRAYYSVGATEYQDEGPWEYEDAVDCEEVHEVEELVKVWRPVSA